MARISPGTMTVAVFAILVGLGGAFVVRQYLHQPPAPPEAAASAVTVPVAAIDLPAGHVLNINDIAVLQFTPAQFPKTEYAKQAYMRNTRQLAGRVLRRELKRGAAFEPMDLYPDGQGPGIAELLRPGLRAVTIPIHNIGAVEGFARPGSVVDVLYRSEASDNRPEVTLTLLEMVEVLAVDKTINPQRTINVGGSGTPTATGTVTLAVSPSQAKALKVVEGRGELSLTLRHPDEQAHLIPVTTTTEKVTLEDLLGIERRRSSMEIYRGADKQTVEFESGQRTRFVDSPIPGFINTPIAADPLVPPPPPVAAPVSSLQETRVSEDAGGS